MELVIAYILVYIVLAVIFAAATMLYSSLIGGLDFGALGHFIVKAGLLVAVVAGVTLLPFGGWLALGAWWIGVVWLFEIDFWDAKILVAIIWGLTVLLRLGLIAALSP